MSTNWQDLINAAGEAGEYAPLPSGDYNVVVATAEATKSSKGSDMIKVKFQVEDGPHKDRLVFNQYVVTPENPNALKWFFRHMNAFGVGQSYFAMNPPLTAVAAQLPGRKVVLTLGQREYQGNPQNDVKATKPRAGAAAPPATGNGVSPVPPAAPAAATPPPVPPIAGEAKPKPF